jgi:hypothetical protein
MTTGGDFGLPQMSERQMFEQLLDVDNARAEDEPIIASNIGQQMLHMNLRVMPKSVRARIRDISGRIPAKNAVLVGGGIGHLAAWLLDLWVGDLSEVEKAKLPRPDSFRIIEPAGKFVVIIERLVRRYNAENWTQVLANPWKEITAETLSWSAATTALPSSARPSPLPQPIDLIILDLPENQRVSAAESAFEILAPGGFILVTEPEVPTGEVPEVEIGENMSDAQEKVVSFNRWINFIKFVNESHTIGFVELSGATLAVIRRSDSTE